MRSSLVWTILLSRDVQRAMAFYRDTVGWSFEPFAGAPYPCWIAKGGDGRTAAAFVVTRESDFPASCELWLPYFQI